MKDTYDKKTVGTRLKLIRKELQISSDDFANKFEISRSLLSGIENGQCYPGFDFLVNAAVKINVNLYYLIFGEGEMFLQEKVVDEKMIDELDPSFTTIADLDWLMKNSRFFKNILLGFAVKVFIENERMIKEEIKHHCGITGKQE